MTAKTKTKKKRGTYWTHNGRHQAEYDRLYEQLVPNEGPCPTRHGELLRAIGNVYYDWFNNGGCNLGLPHFQLALYTIYSWHEEIDKRARGTRGFDGAREILRPAIQWSKKDGSSRSYGMNAEWEKQLELLTDTIIGVVFDAEEDRVPSGLRPTLDDLLAFTNKHRPRRDWHEPDEQDIAAHVVGDKLDNAMGDDSTSGEMVVVLAVPRENGEPAQVEINLASLLALATYAERQ